MILAVTLRGSRGRPRSKRPDILGFAATVEEGRLRVPLLVVTRTTRAKTLKAALVDADGVHTPITVRWPTLAVGTHKDQTLEVT